jgi:hypothetical protein
MAQLEAIVGLEVDVVNGSGWLQDGNKLMGSVSCTMVRTTCGNYDHHHRSSEVMH